jgi:lipoprotein-anchoring transpeptidase ErfK/SrfK
LRRLFERIFPCVRTRRPDRIATRIAALAACAGPLAFAAAPAAALAAPECGPGRATAARVGKPTAAVAWRAGPIGRTYVWSSLRNRSRRSRDSIGPGQAPWLLVLRAARDRAGRCWLRVRLPSRPNDAAAWIDPDRVELKPTRWRLVISRATRAISVYRDGKLRRRFRVVIGAPPTPTPRGLFSIVAVWRWNPADFLGSYILPITAHSDVLQEFGGGDGRIGIHGRGGASLLDPLGTARSHGCIRLSNGPIAWIVQRIGAGALPGIPVRVR